MADVQRPDWTNEGMSSMVRVALWLLAEVGEGGVFAKEQLRAAFPDVTQIDRRMRDLRDYGWQIHTHRDDVSLKMTEQRFVRAGEAIWEPGVRRTGRVRERFHAMGMESAYTLQAPDPEAAWERLKKLSPSERSLVLAWIAMGQRPSSPAELAWRAYRSLPTEKRQELTARLGELVASEIPEETPTSGNGATTP